MIITLTRTKVVKMRYKDGREKIVMTDDEDDAYEKYKLSKKKTRKRAPKITKQEPNPSKKGKERDPAFAGPRGSVEKGKLNTNC